MTFLGHLATYCLSFLKPLIPRFLVDRNYFLKRAKLECKRSISEQECRVRAKEGTLMDRGYQMCCTLQMKDYLLAQRFNFHTHP